LQLREAYTPLGARLERATQLTPDCVVLLGGGEPFASGDVPSRLVRMQEAQDARAAQVRLAPHTAPHATRSPLALRSPPSASVAPPHRWRGLSSSVSAPTWRAARPPPARTSRTPPQSRRCVGCVRQRQYRARRQRLARVALRGWRRGGRWRCEARGRRSGRRQRRRRRRGGRSRQRRADALGASARRCRGWRRVS
jgi:hypothetical protein